MKRILIFIICALLIISVSACKPLDLHQRDNSSELSSQNSRTLIRRLTGTDNIQLIESLSILYLYSPETTAITENKDWTFLEKYAYSHIYPGEELHELFTFPSKISIIEIKYNGFENQVYLMKDGSIVIKEMCGDSEVDEVTYEVYKADEKFALNEENLKRLIEKY